jgi:Lsr2
MAQKIQTLLIDDLDATPAEVTVRFALDGAHYEIDLNAAHAVELRTALARYTDAARKVTGISRRPARNTGKATANGLSTTEIREWAKANGFDIKERGRVPADVVARFRSATGN